jgi:nicotinate dehydrogenase subunit B
MKKNETLKIDPETSLPDFKINRRDFMKVTGSGIFIFFLCGDIPVFSQGEQPGSFQVRYPSDFNAYLRIGEEGRVTCYTGKIEMGQGVVTSLAQMLADELDVSLEAVDMVMGDTDLCPWDMGTFGSMSTRFFGPSLRQAGAEARRVLLELGAEQLKVPAGELFVMDGVIHYKKDKKKNISYARLARGKRIERHIKESIALKTPSEFNIMNKPVTHRDAWEKVSGKALYSGDVRLPGMVYAKILRPPAHGAKFLDADLSEARKLDGVQIVMDGDFIAVLHECPDVAEDALSKIKSRFQKDETGIDDKNIFAHLLKVAPDPQVVASDGSIEQGEKNAASTFEETYLDGYVAHAPIEPHTAVVNIAGNKATVWASTQNPFTLKDEVAKELELSPENVHAIPPFVGGGFGGKTSNIQALEAARLAKLTGKPVMVAWSREEEFFNDTFRPAAIVKVKSGIDSVGNICLWDYNCYFAGQRGAEHFYKIPNHRTVLYGAGWVGPPGSHPFTTGAWRAPSNNTNTFARESQIDIMSVKAGIDPVEFRIRNLEDVKMKHLLKKAAEKFGWKPPKKEIGIGYGISCGTDAGTYVVAMAEVQANRDTGEVKVNRVFCAQDMGLVINPEGAKIQMEGCITMGLGYALKEDIHFKNGEIFDLNFDTYEIPRFSWLPEIETFIVDDKEASPQGGGEPAIINMGAVIGNAIYDARGVRMLQLPMTPERVKAALKG